ncbi:hypothetical protein [Lysinibacillus sp. RC79]|uniref:hypothetical protein n=1 Tax=Lysinibacillus sp. RC79 TaxID=3156296 RepID=UPI00351477B4
MCESEAPTKRQQQQGFVCAKAKRQQQQGFVCAKAKRQQQRGFVCAKAKRQQQQQQREVGHEAAIAALPLLVAPGSQTVKNKCDISSIQHPPEALGQHDVGHSGVFTGCEVLSLSSSL